MLCAFADRYALPLYVTESGTADGEEPDARRCRYLVGCLQAVTAAIEAGADVRGYLHWSFIDNFEWAEGFRPRFGLLHTDFTTQKRSERYSTDMLKKLLRRGA